MYHEVASSRLVYYLMFIIFGVLLTKTDYYLRRATIALLLLFSRSCLLRKSYQMIKCCERKGTTNSAPQWLLLYLIKQIQLQILYFRQSIDHFVARWVLLMFFVIFFLPSWFCHKIQVVIHVTHKILDFARMAVISNRAITLSDSLKNTVDTQDSIKTRHRCIEQCYTIPICIEYNWSGQKKSEQEERKRGKL